MSTSRATALAGSPSTPNRSAHALGGGEVDAAGEHRQRAEQRLVALGQGPVGPFDRVPQRAVAGVRRGAPGLQQVEGPVEAGGQVAERQGPHPAGGQLQRQGQPVQAPDQVGDHGGVVGPRLPPRPAAPGVGEERRHRGDPGDVGPAGLGHGQRAQAQDVLGGQAERLAGRGQHRQVGAGVDQPAGDLPGGVHDVLAVVEDEERPADGQGVPGRVQDGVALDPQAERGGQGAGDQAGLLDLGQLDHVGGPAGLGGVGRDLQRQPGLAHPARADDGDQPLAGDPVAEGRQVVLPPHQRRRGAGPGPDRGGRQRRGRQDTLGGLLLGGHQVGSGIEAGGVAQPAAELVGGPQRVGLATGPGQRPDQQGVGALPVRLGRRGPSGVGHQVGRERAGSGRLQPQGQPLVGEVAAQLGQGDGVGRQGLDGGELVQRRAPPGGQRPAEGRDLVAAAGCARPHVGHVQLTGIQVEPVAGPVPHQPGPRRPQVPAEPRDVAVEGPGARFGRLGRPQGVDQLAGGHHPAAGHGQQRQHRPPPGPGDVDLLAVDCEPQRPQQLDPDPYAGVVRHPPRPSSC